LSEVCPFSMVREFRFPGTKSANVLGNNTHMQDVLDSEGSLNLERGCGSQNSTSRKLTEELL